MTTIGHFPIAQDQPNPQAVGAPASAEGARAGISAFASRLAAQLHAAAGQRAAREGPVREAGVVARARREQEERQESGSATRSMPAAVAAVELRSAGAPGPVEQQTNRSMTTGRREPSAETDRAALRNAPERPTSHATGDRGVSGSALSSSAAPNSRTAVADGSTSAAAAAAKSASRSVPTGGLPQSAPTFRAVVAGASGGAAASSASGGAGRAAAGVGEARAALDRLSRFHASRPRLTAQTESQLVAQAQRALAAVLKTGEGTALIRLRPEGLGELWITLEVRGQSVDATLEARSAEARAALQRRAHELRESLESRGLVVDRLTVALLPERVAAEHAGAWSAAQERRGGDGSRKDGPRRGVAIAAGAAGTGNALESVGAVTRSVGAMDRPRSGLATWGGAQLESIRLDAIA